MHPRRVDLCSVTVRIAYRLGLLSAEQARKADELVQENTDDSPTLKILVQEGLLTKVQAEMVREEREKTSTLEHLSEAIKKARDAVQKSVPQCFRPTG